MSRFSQKFLETHIFAPLKAKAVAANAQKKNLKQKILPRVVGSIQFTCLRLIKVMLIELFHENGIQAVSVVLVAISGDQN